MGEDVQNQKPRTVYVFPRVRIREGASRKEHFRVGPLTVLPDDDAVWQDEFSKPRPSWLQIFRDFPDVRSDRDGDQARGSIVIADNDSWIEEHISRVVGIFYFLGLSTNDWRVPSEALSHIGFKLTTSPGNMVELCSKSGRFIESDGSLRFPPPLALRGLGNAFNLDLEKASHQKLCNRFFKNPFDSIAIACFHLYRTQWGDFLQSPHEQDYAAYCACLEAAMNIKKDYPKNLYLELRKRYVDYPNLEKWVQGLYSERSVFNHGATGPIDPTSRDPRMQAWIFFRKKRCNWQVTRELCRDVIHHELEPSASPAEHFWMLNVNTANTYLRQMLLSQDAWCSVCDIFLTNQSVQKLQSIVDDDKEFWIKVALTFIRNHDWRFHSLPINEQHLLCALRAAAAGMGVRARERDDPASVLIWSTLYKAATNKTREEVRHWFFERKRNGDSDGIPDTVDAAFLQIATQIAQYFSNLFH